MLFSLTGLSPVTLQMVSDHLCKTSVSKHFTLFSTVKVSLLRSAELETDLIFYIIKMPVELTFNTLQNITACIFYKTISINFSS